MNVFMLYTPSGPVVILTSYEAPTSPNLVAKLEAKGITKFLAWRIPLEIAKQRYGGHFLVVAQDLAEKDDLRILDYNGERAFRLFSFAELGSPTTYEKPA